jgi:polysaccharide export outer membrane protein
MSSHDHAGISPSRRSCLVWLVWLALAGCGGPGTDLPLLPVSGPVDYSLGPGDQVRIITFGEETLTGEFRVNDSGNIALPLVGAVHAAGLTSAGLETAVGSALRRGNLVRNPSVAVEVIAYRPIYVLGEVNKPGQYGYQPGMTVVTAVAVAGGFTYRAVEGYAAIVRTVEGRAVEGRASRQSYVRPGDTITVFERRF